MNIQKVRRLLRAHASPANAAILQRFFKTGCGQYGEGDRFLGVRVPQIRSLLPVASQLPPRDVLPLLASPWHEERLLALLIWIHHFEQGGIPTQRFIFNLYLKHSSRINNWDLVDLSAPNIAGTWLLEKPRDVLYKMAGTGNLWQRRIAIVSTLTFIRNGQFNDTCRLSRLLLTDRHDLMHKACGWMLREMGKRNTPLLEQFLERHAHAMPRTMLRYAIEKFPEPRRKMYLNRRILPKA